MTPTQHLQKSQNALGEAFSDAYTKAPTLEDLQEIEGKLAAVLDSSIREAYLLAAEEVEKMLPTRDTKITIQTDRDPHDTTPQSLVAMGYHTALTDVANRLREITKTP
jgi:hypothetical protein